MEESKYDGLICPECAHPLEIMCVIGADKSLSHVEERLCHCNHCLSSWTIVDDCGPGVIHIQRYFFG